LEEVSITKVVPNYLFYLNKIYWVFITFLSIFLVMRIVFRIYLESENPWHGARFSGKVLLSLSSGWLNPVAMLVVRQA
jgi:hypothetical protein